MKNKLRRSKDNRMIAGVCGGIGEFLNIDPAIIRLVWILFMFMSDTPALLAYIACLFIIPEDDGTIYSDYKGNDESGGSCDMDSENVTTSKNSNLFVGIGLILIGAYLLTKRIWPQFAFKFLQLKQYWPALLIVLGLYIIGNRFKDNN